MKTIGLPSALGLVLMLGLHATPAEALLQQSYVSRTGNLGSTCNYNDPCLTFIGAHAATENGGQITCLDSGPFDGFEMFVVTKSITFDCEVHKPASFGIQINGAGAAVVLRGVSFYGRYAHDIGVNFIAGQELHIEHSTITGYTNGNSGFAAGINVTAGSGRLFVSDTVVSLNGSASSGGGIIIQPSGSGNRRVVLNRVQVTNNTVGIISVGGAGSTIVEVRDSTVTGNFIAGAASHGIFSQSSSGLSAIVIDRSSISLNSGNGIMAQGASTLVHIGRSTVRGNLAGGLTAGSGASILSYGDNHTKGNGVDGAPTGVLAPN